METLLLWLGRIAGLAGVAICALATVSRLAGAFYVAGFQTGTLLQGGMMALLVSCVCFLAVLTRRSRP